MRNTFIDTVLNAAEKKEEIFIVSGDAGLGVFDGFKKEFPQKFLNLGVAEQNAASFCAGMALSGFKVYLYNIIPFLLYRCYEQVRNDICYQELPVVLVGIGSGVTYAPQGVTHYSIEDLGIGLTLPNLTVFSPIDPVEAKKSALYSLGCRLPMYVRLPKRGEPRIHEDEDFDITKPQLIKEGSGVAIVFHGSISVEVLEARKLLEKEGIYPRLISLPMLKPFDFEALSAFLEKIDHLITVEEHYSSSGLGALVAMEHVKRRPAWRLFSLGIPDGFIHQIKDCQGMREHFGISAEKITGFIKDIYLKRL